MLRECRVDEDSVKLARSFMEERLVMLEQQERRVSRGCPQGSSLGPVLWVVLMQDWFARMEQDLNEEVHAQAYADDQILVIGGTSVKVIENKWKSTWEKCEKWAEANKLKYNVNKTEAMFATAGREVRAPVIWMDGKKIKINSHVKYLGIKIDRKLNWIEHARHIRGKVQERAMKFFSLSRRKWSKKPAMLKAIFEGAVVPMLMYGAEVWGSRGMDSRIKRQLRAAERPYLRAIAGAYRTASVEALATITGCVPLQVRIIVAHEAYVNWNEAVQSERVQMKDRVHPALRGWLPIGDGAEWERAPTIFTEIKGRQAGPPRAGTATGKRGGEIYSGKTDINRLECLGILGGIRIGAERLSGTGTRLVVSTDSEQAVKRIRAGRTKDRIINTVGNRTAGNLARSLLAQEGGINLGNGGARQKAKLWKEDRELTLWQRRWDSETGGRWTHELMPRVGKEGIVQVLGGKLTQLMTGHGNFRGYLARFALIEDEGQCQCGEGVEDIQHVVNVCTKRHRVMERERLTLALGVYPPRIGNLTRDRWDELKEWAEVMIEDHDMIG